MCLLRVRRYSEPIFSLTSGETRRKGTNMKENLDTTNTDKEKEVASVAVPEEQDLDLDLDLDEESDEDEEIEDKPEEPEQATLDDKKPKATLSKAEIALINLKKENKALLHKLQEKSTSDEKQQLAQDFVKQGYPEDQAGLLAASEIRTRKLEEKLVLMDFRDSNAEAFALYPQAKAETAKVMKAVEATGMTADQICRVLYGSEQTPDYELRAREAAKGNSTRTVSQPSSSLTQSSSAGVSQDNAELSTWERNLKRKIEREFRLTKPLTVQEFREHIKLDIRK